MKKKFRLFTMAAVLLSASAAIADNNLVVQSAGTHTPYPISSVRIIRFGADGFSICRNGQADVNYNYANVDKIYFTLSTTGFENIIDDETRMGISIDPSGSIITVNGISSGNVNIYNYSGMQVKNLPNWQGERINIADLPKGVYILKINNQSTKFNK